MGSIFSRAKSVSDRDENELENIAEVSEEFRTLAESECQRILNAEDGDSAGEAISSVTHALERVRQYNKTILDVVKNANVEAKEVAVEVLNRYRRCNEKTLELVDSLTTSTAKLQDANALYKEAAIAVQGDDPNQNRERLQMWIAKARSVQEAASTSDQKNDGIHLPQEDRQSTKILTDMKDQVDGVIKSYEELREYIELAKTKSSQEFWRTIRSQVGRGVVALTLVGLLCGGAALLLICSRQPALLLSIPTIIGVLCTLVMAKSGTEEYRAACKHRDEILAKLSQHDYEINLDREQLVFTRSAISHVEVALKQVWNKFDILKNPNIDPKRLSEIGEELRSKCEKMDQEFIALKTEIEHLRQQVVNAHHYIVRSRRPRA